MINGIFFNHVHGTMKTFLHLGWFHLYRFRSLLNLIFVRNHMVRLIVQRLFPWREIYCFFGGLLYNILNTGGGDIYG